MFGQVPFYASPPRHKTSAEIISEARAAIHKDGSSLHSLTGGGASMSGPRPVGTRRPHTPREPTRVLFGPDARRDRPHRPPSSFNLRHLRFQALDTVDQPPAQRVSQSNPVQHRLVPVPLPKGASLDEELFSSLLAESDIKKAKNAKKPKPPLPTANTSKLGLQAEVKPKLPTLSGLPKPLHKRQTLHSLHEEHEEYHNTDKKELSRLRVNACVKDRPTTSPDVQGKQIYCSFYEGDSPDRETIVSPKRHDFTQITDFPPRTSLDEDLDLVKEYVSSKTRHVESGVSRVFNRRRLFTDYKSASADSGLGRLLPPEDKPDEACFERVPKKIESVDDCIISKEDFKSDSDTKTRSTTKLAIEIPSPDVNENWLRTGRQPSIPQADRLDSKKVLEMLATKSEGDMKNDDKTVKLLKELYDRLEEEGLFVQDNGKKKSSILKTLYNYVESTDDRILICLARILLAMRVTGSNLSAAFKLIFKVARNDKNDNLFLEDNIMELVIVSIGRTSPCDGGGGYGAVYALGALRFLALGARTRAAAAAAGANHLMTLQLKIVNTQKSESPRSVDDDIAHAMYQLTGAMRNMAQYHDRYQSRDKESETQDCNDDPVFKDFLDSGAVRELCSTIELFATDLDVVTNVARIFSVVSGRAQGRDTLASCPGWAGTLQRALSAAPRRRQLAVRLAYALGNMAAHSDSARIQIFEEQGSVECFLDVIELYVRRCVEGKTFDAVPKSQRGSSHQTGHGDNNPDDPDNSIIGSDLAGSDGSNEDVLIKSIRVVANVCLNQEAGRGTLLAGDGRALPALLAAVRCSAQMSARPRSAAFPRQNILSFSDIKLLFTRNSTFVNSPTSSFRFPSGEDSPLTATALAAISNLTYYIEDTENDNRIHDLQIQLCKAMFDVLNSYDQPSWSSDCCVEALRVLGNASRWRTVRDYLVTKEGLHMLVKYLLSPVSEARRSTAGVLVNCAGGSADGARLAGTLARMALCAGIGSIGMYHSEGSNATAHHPASITRLNDLSSHSFSSTGNKLEVSDVHHRGMGIVDWRLRTLLAQAAWNAAEDPEGNGVVSDIIDDADEFADALDEMLDEERIFCSDFPHEELPLEDGYDYDAWEEFASVAVNILDRICPSDHSSANNCSLETLHETQDGPK